MLNYFRGGPIHGYAYETTLLLTHAALPVPLEEYRWTPELVTSETTGRQARVWIHMTGDSMTNPYLARRNALKMSRSDLATRAGISPSQVVRVETGLTGVKAGTVDAIEQVLTTVEMSRNPHSALG